MPITPMFTKHGVSIVRRKKPICHDRLHLMISHFMFDMSEKPFGLFGHLCWVQTPNICLVKECLFHKVSSVSPIFVNECQGCFEGGLCFSYWRTLAAIHYLSVRIFRAFMPGFYGVLLKRYLPGCQCSATIQKSFELLKKETRLSSSLPAINSIPFSGQQLLPCQYDSLVKRDNPARPEGSSAVLQFRFFRA